jgi:hypothetical protein
MPLQTATAEILRLARRGPPKDAIPDSTGDPAPIQRPRNTPRAAADLANCSSKELPGDFLAPRIPFPRHATGLLPYGPAGSARGSKLVFTAGGVHGEVDPVEQVVSSASLKSLGCARPTSGSA